MSIATAITNLQGKIANAYTAIENKGGTLPATQNAENLSATIDGIPAGSSTKWGMTIDEIGYVDDAGELKPFEGLSGETLNMTGVKSVKLATFYEAFKDNTSLKSVSFPDLSTDAEKAFTYAFQNCTNLSSISFPNLLSVDGGSSFSNAFRDCTSLSSVSFPELERINNGTSINDNNSDIFASVFIGCTSLSSVSFPKLHTAIAYAGTSNMHIFYSAFRGCTSLSSISFPELSTIAGNGYFGSAFQSCTALTAVSFPKLKTTYGNGIFNNAFIYTALTTLSFPELSAMRNSGSGSGYAPFKGNTTITRIDFPKLTVIAKGNNNNVDGMYLFNDCTNLAELHFGAENQSIIESASGYATKWGAPSGCQIYFDL